MSNLDLLAKVLIKLFERFLALLGEVEAALFDVVDLANRTFNLYLDVLRAALFKVDPFLDIKKKIQTFIA